MGFSLVNNEGSGSVKDDAIATYSYSEDVTSLEPSNLTGGTGQVTVTSVAVDENTVGSTHPNSKLMINNLMTLTDGVRGQIDFRVKNVSAGDGNVTVTGDTIISRLNVSMTALPHGGAGYTLLSAIQYYCGLVGIEPVIDEALLADLDALPVNFIGWTGNVWEYLKMLCAGVSISTEANVGIEMFVSKNTLTFRKARQNFANFSEYESEKNININSFEAAQKIEINNYNTYYGVDEVVKEQVRTSSLFAKNENVSITDSLQVEAGTTLTKRFKINATLETVSQPDCVSQILPLPYSGASGQYVVVGNDNLPIEPAEWLGQGGSVVVSLTDVPDEIEIAITAPAAVSLPTAADPVKVTNAPYKIGVETADDVDYPALYIVGTGVFFTKTSATYLTGASSDYTSKVSAVTVDNPFITNDFDQATRGIAAAQAACGPSVVLNQTVTESVYFGITPGTMQSFANNKFRITSASYSPDPTTLSAIAMTSFADFDAVWPVNDFADFTVEVFDGSDASPLKAEALKFNEFTIIPLIGA